MSPFAPALLLLALDAVPAPVPHDALARIVRTEPRDTATPPLLARLADQSPTGRALLARICHAQGLVLLVVPDPALQRQAGVPGRVRFWMAATTVYGRLEYQVERDRSVGALVVVAHELAHVVELLALVEASPARALPRLLATVNVSTRTDRGRAVETDFAVRTAQRVAREVLRGHSESPALTTGTATRSTPATSSVAREAIERALRLLPRRPTRVVVVDARDAAPALREMLTHTDAFVTTGDPTVYLKLQGQSLRLALEARPFYDHVLAATIWHEMAHVAGGDERAARAAEAAIWKQFVAAGRVDERAGMRMLTLLLARS